MPDDIWIKLNEEARTLVQREPLLARWQDAPARIDALGGDLLTGHEREVRGRKADLPASVVAVHDGSLDGWQATEQRGSVCDVARVDQIADA